ncbi:hypothetical protein P256_02434 [Acinetobacter nectaris CIP 110549]|uniref:Peptidyl-prolyl cis-trans isomerase n=1 Tax=Acinetobacter nectaris CIP 110549 TaxID=1392540 RepID=V2T3E6_9GAMM|nr:FKBP-type peptidyl-prolyl cis-trans isomerase [Acinetobacter nectaris]ESK36988.1 hypothetical protein P256_02434 [Acinetobacter nectaris CIP 110549]
MNKTLIGLLSVTLATATFAANNTSTNTLNEQEAYKLGAELAKTNKDASNALKQDMEDAQKKENRSQNDNNRQSSRSNNAQEDGRITSKNERNAEPKQNNNISNDRQSDNSYTARQRTVVENKDRAFFTENSRRLGVVTTDSGLQYQVLKAGLGRIPRNQHNVRISYEVKDLNERSILRQTDQSVRLSRLMPALSEGIQTMREKGKTRFFIPTGLTSGIKDLSASIPENTSLIIDVELQSIE